MKLLRKKNCDSLNFVGGKRGIVKLLNFFLKKRLPANDEEFERN
jgi:hypothetical protein